MAIDLSTNRYLFQRYRSACGQGYDFLPKIGEECLLDTMPDINEVIPFSRHYANAKHQTIDEEEYENMEEKDKEVS